MRWRIGTGFGIPVYIHWSFLFLPLLILSGSHEPGMLPVILTVVPLMFACVVLHEFGHALMARYFGIATHDVTLYPIGGVARLVRMTERPLEEFLIAIAGPAVNVVIAVVLGGVLFAARALHTRMYIGPFAETVLFYVLASNIVMILFNLLPAFPMDGGRVLRALLATWMGHYQATHVAVVVGVTLAVALAVAAIIVLPDAMLLPVVMGFVVVAGLQELAMVRARERRRRWEDEEPAEVIPVQPYHPQPSFDPPAPVPALIFQPRISVYTWDNHTGTWRKDA
jgi:Zn-dependent protease